MPEHYDTARTADWLDGYRFALTNLHQPGVLADAHRYVDEDTAPPREQPGDRVRVTFHPIRGQETPDPVESTVTGLGNYVGRLAVNRGSATVEVIEPAAAIDDAEPAPVDINLAADQQPPYGTPVDGRPGYVHAPGITGLLTRLGIDGRAAVLDDPGREEKPAPRDTPPGWDPAVGDWVTGVRPDGHTVTGPLSRWTLSGLWAVVRGSVVARDTLRPADTTQEAR